MIKHGYLVVQVYIQQMIPCAFKDIVGTFEAELINNRILNSNKNNRPLYVDEMVNWDGYYMHPL